MNVEDQIKVVQKAVESFYQQVQNDSYMPELYESQKQHVIQIGTSILCTRWGIGYEGGGFVQSSYSECSGEEAQKIHNM